MGLLRPLLFIFLIVLALLSLSSPCEACPCALSTADCKIPLQAQIDCCLGNNCDPKCLRDHGVSAESISCAHAIDQWRFCLCTPLFTRCSLENSADLSAGGRCKMSGVGIAIAVSIGLASLVFIGIVTFLTIYRIRKARDMAGTEYQVLAVDQQTQYSTTGSATVITSATVAIDNNQYVYQSSEQFQPVGAVPAYQQPQVYTNPSTQLFYTQQQQVPPPYLQQTNPQYGPQPTPQYGQ